MPVRIEIDRSQRLDRGAARGHNRWHPDIDPVAVVEPGDTVTFEIRDSRDREITRESTHADMLELATLAHPLTGPLEVAGAEPGDVLELEVLGYETDDFGWTAIFPGAGFLPDVFTEPFVATWELADGVARSGQLPGVAVPACAHAGVIGVAPSRELFERALTRERQLAERGGRVHLPDPLYAWPPEAAEGLRTYPPRENGGNMDVRQMVAGTRILFPVWVAGALFSAGDGHFAQGDGESCGTAIETRTTLRVRLGIRRGEAADRRLRDVRFESPAGEPAHGPCVATTGLCVYADGGRAEDLTLAARHALVNMIHHLVAEYGFSRQQAYALSSVAVDLRVGQVVDAPNYLATASLPLDVVAARR
jgi:formamidase